MIEYQERVEADRKIVEDYQKMMAKNHKPITVKEQEEKFTLELDKKELKEIYWALMSGTRLDNAEILYKLWKELYQFVK